MVEFVAVVECQPLVLQFINDFSVCVGRNVEVARHSVDHEEAFHLAPLAFANLALYSVHEVLDSDEVVKHVRLTQKLAIFRDPSFK
jgi:hypothetical protein